MTEVSAELVFEVLKQIQDRLGRLEGRMDEVKGELQAIRTHMLAFQQDFSGIHMILVRYEGRFERIERRLELTDAPQL